jgi:hypothetical protein
MRITTHQPNSAHCHAESIRVEVSDDGISYRYFGTAYHDAVWSPPGGNVDWDVVESPDFMDLPGGGRLAYAYWVWPFAAASGRFVRCHFYPLAGRGLSLSEIQVFSEATIQPWPAKEIFIPGATPVAPGGEATEPAPANAASLSNGLLCTPNPFNAKTNIAYAVRRNGPVDLRVYDLAGRQVKQLVASVWQPAGLYQVTWDGRDVHGRHVASGVYLCRLVSERDQKTARLVLVK